MSRNITNNNREILYARSTITGQPEYIGSTNHALNINATISSDGIATSANQTNGSQLTQIVDAGGEAVTVTGGKLDVNATASLAGESLPISGATEAVGVAIVDSSGNQISSFGGGTQYTNGDIDASPVGTVAMWLNTGDNSINAVSDTAPLPVMVDSGNINVANAVQVIGSVVSGENDDNPTVLKVGTQYNTTQPTFSDGDRGEFQMDNRGNLKTLINNDSGASAVNIQDGGNSITIDSGTLNSIDSKITTVDTDSVVITSSALPSGAATAANQQTDALTNTQLRASAVPVTGTITAVTSITNALPAGSNAIGKLSANSGVDIGDVDVMSVTPGTAATNLGKAEDAAHSSGDVGVMPLAVANEALTSLSGTDADYTPFSVDRKGRVFVRQNSNTASDANVSTSTTVATLLASNSARISGSIYNDSAVVLYVRFGANATSTAFKVALAANTYYEIPGGYTGSITGILASSTGTARVAEET